MCHPFPGGGDPAEWGDCSFIAPFMSPTLSRLIKHIPIDYTRHTHTHIHNRATQTVTHRQKTSNQWCIAERERGEVVADWNLTTDCLCEVITLVRQPGHKTEKQASSHPEGKWQPTDTLIHYGQSMTQRQSHTTYKQNSLNSLVINCILICLVSHQNIGAESKAELHLLYHSVGAARQLQQAEARISFQAEEDPIWSMWGKSRTWCNGCLWQHPKDIVESIGTCWGLCASRRMCPRKVPCAKTVTIK